MKPSKKDIKAAVDKLKNHDASKPSINEPDAKLSAAKNSKRIRKQGI